MQNRGLHKTMRGQYEPAQWTGENLSGMRPIYNMVVVKPDKPATKIGSIHITDQSIETQQYAAETGVVVAVSDGAFIVNAQTGQTFTGTPPKPGDRVGFERYCGAQQLGKDGELYFFMRDYNIGVVHDA